VLNLHQQLLYGVNAIFETILCQQRVPNDNNVNLTAKNRVSKIITKVPTLAQICGLILQELAFFHFLCEGQIPQYGLLSC
ncbi:hypothetical protein ACJX0J_017123, partial [Zea mays]